MFFLSVFIPPLPKLRRGKPWFKNLFFGGARLKLRA
jgi:hypothetical protein